MACSASLVVLAVTLFFGAAFAQTETPAAGGFVREPGYQFYEDPVGGRCETYRALDSCAEFVDYPVFLNANETQESITAFWASVTNGVSQVSALSPTCAQLGAKFLCGTMWRKCSEYPTGPIFDIPCNKICNETYTECVKVIPPSVLNSIIFCPLFPEKGLQFVPSNRSTVCNPLEKTDSSLVLCAEGFAPCNGTCCAACPIQLADANQEDFLQKWIQACAWVSFFSAIFCSATWLVFPSKRSFPSIIVLFLSLASLGVSISFIISLQSGNSIHCKDAVTPADRSVPGCFFQSVFFHFFFLALACWWLCFAFNVNQLVVHNKTLQGFSKFYHTFSWGVPALLTIISIATDSIQYSRTARFCFLEERVGPLIGLFFIWLGVIGLVGTLLMLEVMWTIMRVSQAVSQHKSGKRTKIPIRSIIFILGYNFIIVFTFFYNIATVGLLDKINQAQVDYDICLANGDYIYFWPNGTYIGPNPLIIVDELYASGMQITDLRPRLVNDCVHDSPVSFPLVVINTTLITLVGLWVFLLFGLTTENAALWERFITKGRTSFFSGSQSNTRTSGVTGGTGQHHSRSPGGKSLDLSAM